MSDIKNPLTTEDLLNMRDRQDDACAICERHTYGGLSPDYDRRSNAVRGLLCSACIGGLEAFDDDPQRLSAAASYVTSHREQPSGLYYRPLSTLRSSEEMTMREFLRGGYKEAAGPTMVVDGRRHDAVVGQWLPAASSGTISEGDLGKLTVSHNDPPWLQPRPRVGTRRGSGPGSPRQTTKKVR